VTRRTLFNAEPQSRKTRLPKGRLTLLFSSHEDSQLANPFAESKSTIGGIMETYTLFVLVALFLGVMGIIAMLERRRRTELAQFEQLQQTLAAIHSGNEAQFARAVEAVLQLRAEAERTTKAIQDLQASLEESIKF
jgi:uncharacterized membrane protein YcjF (UPF0283 family)